MKIAKIKLVFDRRHKAAKDKEGAIDIRVAYGGKQKFMSTGVAVLPTQWDVKQECVKFRPDAVAVNSMLRQLVNRCHEMIDEMAEKGAVDLAKLSRVTDSRTYDMTFIEYIKKRIPERNVSEHTRERYRCFVRAFEQWGKMMYFTEITESNIRSFDEWLHRRIVDGKYLMQSTIATYHKYLKIFINDAMTDELVCENPYQSKRIRIDKAEGGQIACLTAEQVEQIEKLDIKDGSLERTRDLFLFQCYTGLAYSDLMKFRLSDCEKEDDGSYRLNDRRTKTNTEYTLYLTDKAVAIAEKYDGILPSISNQKYNMFLKALGQMIGEPKLHSHMGRSTFASMMLNNGVSTDIIKHALGHTTTLQTNRYATMRDKTIKDAFKKME